jgi:hypothetical protein
MRRAVLLAGVVAVPLVFGLATNVAAGQPYPGTISGETLLRDYMGPPQPRDDQFLKGGDIVDHEMARGYMNGIKDATEGAAWCYVAGKSHELNDDIAAVLMKLKPEELKGRAAPLVVNALRQRFPCPPDRRKP